MRSSKKLSSVFTIFLSLSPVPQDGSSVDVDESCVVRVVILVVIFSGPLVGICSKIPVEVTLVVTSGPIVDICSGILVEV